MVFLYIVFFEKIIYRTKQTTFFFFFDKHKTNYLLESVQD